VYDAYEVSEMSETYEVSYVTDKLDAYEASDTREAYEVSYTSDKPDA
jgi:hypothetical protein